MPPSLQAAPAHRHYSLLHLRGLDQGSGEVLDGVGEAARSHVPDQGAVEEGEQGVGEEAGVGARALQQGGEVGVPEAVARVGELVAGAGLLVRREQDGVALRDRAEPTEEGEQAFPGGRRNRGRRPGSSFWR
ncbi:hypothetical protein ACFWYW_54180 [Nonomuraea sp. NPDC059023]|uniref:hypothetical protein n=1 Tax=unclassified Nonomuraea TaxID=2593643 RepID=UPI0036824DB1